MSYIHGVKGRPREESINLSANNPRSSFSHAKESWAELRVEVGRQKGFLCIWPAYGAAGICAFSRSPFLFVGGGPEKGYSRYGEVKEW